MPRNSNGKNDMRKSEEKTAVKKEKSAGKKLTKKAIALIVVGSVLVAIVAVALGLWFGIYADRKYDFDLKKYLSEAQLVWSDEFDGAEIDSTKWLVEGQGHENNRIPRRGGYWSTDAVSVSDGFATISTYKGEDGFYYTGALNSQYKYESKYGYYEIRCKLPKAYGIWSAFWLMPIGDEFEEGNGDGKTAGNEIDVFEAPAYPREKVQQTVHIGGYGAGQRTVTNVKWLVNELGDLYDDFHTYGVYWNEDIYIFYVDGKVVWKTDVSGHVSSIDEYMIISTEIGGKVGKDGIPKTAVAWGNPTMFKNPDTELNDWSKSAEFVIDYVRHYK